MLLLVLLLWFNLKLATSNTFLYALYTIYNKIVWHLLLFDKSLTHTSCFDFSAILLYICQHSLIHGYALTNTLTESH